MDPREVIAKIAEAASIVAFQAGVGGCELAGSIISYLAAHPDKIETFLNEGYGAVFIPDALPMPHPWRDGCLSWLGMDGVIHGPVERAPASLTTNGEG